MNGMTPSDLKPMSSSTSSLSILTTRAGDDVAVVELDDRGVDRVGERLPAEVVEHDQLVLRRSSAASVAASAAGVTSASLSAASGVASVASPLSSGTVAVVAASVTS